MYRLIFLLMLLSLFGIFITKIEIKKLIFLNFFQTSIIFFYLYSGFMANISPIPIVLMLTAIVVGFANFALGVMILDKSKKV